MERLQMTSIQKTAEESIVLTVLELAAQMLKKGANLTNTVGLTTQQWMVLLYIQGDPNIPYAEERLSEGGILASDIAEALHVSRPNITNLLQALTDKGFVVQVKDRKDKRRKLLRLTTKGREATEQIEPIRKAANRRLLSAFDENEKRQFLHMLKHCLDKLHAKN